MGFFARYLPSPPMGFPEILVGKLHRVFGEIRMPFFESLPCLGVRFLINSPPEIWRFRYFWPDMLVPQRLPILCCHCACKMALDKIQSAGMQVQILSSSATVDGLLLQKITCVNPPFKNQSLVKWKPPSFIKWKQHNLMRAFYVCHMFGLQNDALGTHAIDLSLQDKISS